MSEVGESEGLWRGGGWSGGRLDRAGDGAVGGGGSWGRKGAELREQSRDGHVGGGDGGRAVNLEVREEGSEPAKRVEMRVI